MEQLKSKEGFTLIEVLIATVILGITFTVLLGLLYQAQRDLNIAKTVSYNFLILDSSIKEGRYEGINIKTREINILSIPVIETTYEKNGVYIKTYQAK